MKKPTRKKILSILKAWYLVGILGFAFPFSRPLFQFLIPLSLLLLFLIFTGYHERPTRWFWISLILVFLTGFGIEVAGVKTGIIFGEYTYGNTLGPKLFGVPLIMGINWIIMIYGGVALSSALSNRPVAGSLISAIVITANDFFIEKFAVFSGMWEWEAGVPPQRNYLAWFGFSFLLSLLIYKTVAERKRPVAIHGFIYQFAFFLVSVLINFLFWS